MLEALANTPITDFKRPNGLVEATIDSQTGLLAPSNCSLPKDQVRTELFIPGTEPKEISPRCSTLIWDILPFR